jgi:hypothetical protein
MTSKDDIKGLVSLKFLRPWRGSLPCPPRRLLPVFVLRLEEGQGARGGDSALWYFSRVPVLVPDVEGDKEDNDDDGGEEHHPHDEEGGAGHRGAVGQGRRRTLHPAPEGQGERHGETNRRIQKSMAALNTVNMGLVIIKYKSQRGIFFRFFFFMYDIQH